MPSWARSRPTETRLKAILAHESFEIARLMNERFINIKVDCTFSPPGAQPIS